MENLLAVKLNETIAYSVHCVRNSDKSCIMNDDVVAATWIKIDDFAKYWIKSFGETIVKKLGNNDKDGCSITINCSTGETKTFKTQANMVFEPQSKKVVKLPVEVKPAEIEVEAVSDTTKSAYTETEVPALPQEASEKQLEAEKPKSKPAKKKSSEKPSEKQEKKVAKTKIEKPKADSPKPEKAKKAK